MFYYYKYKVFLLYTYENGDKHNCVIFCINKIIFLARNYDKLLVNFLNLKYHI